MAKVRIGFSTQFELENELVGIGTDNPTQTLQALGNIRSSNAQAVGLSTFTTFDGFVDTKAAIAGAGGAKSGSISGEIIIDGNISVSTGTTFTSGLENLTATDNFTLPGISEDDPSVGTTRFNENLGALEFYTGVEWRAVNYRIGGTSSGRGLLQGGYNPGRVTTVESVQIPSLGNAEGFGDLTVARSYSQCCSDGSRALCAGGNDGTPFSDVIDYIAIQSSGNYVDFGNLQDDQGWGAGGCSSSTRGLFSSWYPASNVIDYVEIQTTGNASDFGDISSNALAGGPAACSSPTRGFWAGGYVPSPAITPQKNIDMVTISSKGNSITFGELTKKRGAFGGCSNTTRGIWGGGSDWQPSTAEVHNTIDYVTMSSTGNATDFGDLTLRRGFIAATSTQIRGIFAGARQTPALTNNIDYITIATTGHAADFCDMRTSKEIGMTSDSHGGLGGF